MFYEQKLMFWNFKKFGDIFLALVTRKKIENFLLFSRYCTIFSTFLENWTWGVCAGPQNFIFEYVGYMSIGNNMFWKKVFLTTPPGYTPYFRSRCIFVPPGGPKRSSRSSAEKMWIFCLHYQKSFLSTLRVLTFGFRFFCTFKKYKAWRLQTTDNGRQHTGW